MPVSFKELPGEPPGTGDSHARLRHLATVCALVALVVAGSLAHEEIARLLDCFVDWCQELGWVAPLLWGLMVSALQLCMVPTFPLMVGAGVIFPKSFGLMLGQAIGVSAVFAGLWLGSMLTFLLGRRCFKQWAEEELRKFAWMNVINSMVDEHGCWVVLLARMSPLVPAEIFNYACALTSLSVWSFGVGCLGSFVPTCMWVCSSASAAAAASAAASGESADPAEGARKMREHMAFLLFNVAFLLALTGVLYVAVKKYTEKADHHVGRELESLRRGCTVGELPDEVKDLRRLMTKSVLTLRRDAKHHHAAVYARAQTFM